MQTQKQVHEQTTTRGRTTGERKIAIETGGGGTTSRVHGRIVTAAPDNTSLILR